MSGERCVSVTICDYWKRSPLLDILYAMKPKNKHLIIAPSESEKLFFDDISRILNEGRQKAHVAVNYAMVEAYWNIGRRIVEQEQQGKERANYGDQVIVGLSRYLSASFGRGFSEANLWNFRQFYLTWPSEEIRYTLCRELSWSHIRLIMRLDSEKARKYYLNEARLQGWSVRVLERNIHTNYFERLISSQNVISPADEQKNRVGTEDFIKDPYVLEFLDLPENPTPKESSLESAIISHLQDFLLEMGRGFSFVGRQFRISTETTHFYIDLVFYHSSVTASRKRNELSHLFSPACPCRSLYFFKKSAGVIAGTGDLIKSPVFLVII